MTRLETLPMLTASILRLANEHGRPNTASPAELERLHQGAPRGAAAAIGRDSYGMILLNQRLRSAGWKGSPVMYGRGRFAI